MVKAFKNLLLKEVKSIIRDPKMLIAMFVVPLIMIAVVYGFMGLAMRQQAEQALRESGVVAVIDLDNGVWSKKFIDFLRDRGIDVKMYRGSLDNIGDVMEDLGVKILYIIPENFSEALSSNRTGCIEYYVLFKSLTFMELGIHGRASNLINSFSENITRSITVKTGYPREFLEKPINSTARAVVAGKVVGDPLQVLSSIFSTSLVIPLAVFIMIIFIIQFAVTSMAVEKEEKMFETLLTLPINRMSILGVKLLVSVAIGIAYVLIYGAILIWFFFGAMGSPGETTSGPQFSLTLPPGTIEYMGVGLIGAVLFGLLVAFILSLFAEDVRTAQLVSNYALMPLIFLFFLPMFIDVSNLSYTVRTALALVPIANVSFIPKLMILGNYELGVLAGLSNIAYALGALAIAYKIVNSERIFTARLLQRIKARKGRSK